MLELEKYELSYIIKNVGYIWEVWSHFKGRTLIKTKYRCHEQWIITGFDMSQMNEIQIGVDREDYFLQEIQALG